MAKLIEFRKKYDFLQDEFRKCYDEREILMNTIRKFEATKPEAYDSSGAISLAVCVFTVSFCIIDNHYSGPMFILLWLILLTVIVGLTKAWITYQKYCTEIELKDWEQNTKPKIIHLVQNINNNTFKTRTISQSLKEFAIDLHTHIKTFRTNINISTNQLRKFTYFINQYVLQGGKHYYEREWSDNWGIKYYINSWDFGTLKIYSYSSSPNYNYKNIIHDILVEIDETVDSNKETIRKEKELRLISKLKYNIKNQIGEQVKQLRKQINKEITSTNLGLDIEKQYELREALVKIRLRQDVNWLRNNGMSEEFIVATSDNWEAREQKKLANHSAFEGRIKYSDKEKIKKKESRTYEKFI